MTQYTALASACNTGGGLTLLAVAGCGPRMRIERLRPTSTTGGGAVMGCCEFRCGWRDDRRSQYDGESERETDGKKRFFSLRKPGSADQTLQRERDGRCGSADARVEPGRAGAVRFVQRVATASPHGLVVATAAHHRTELEGKAYRAGATCCVPSTAPAFHDTSQGPPTSEHVGSNEVAGRRSRLTAGRLCLQYGPPLWRPGIESVVECKTPLDASRRRRMKRWDRRKESFWRLGR